MIHNGVSCRASKWRGELTGILLLISKRLFTNKSKRPEDDLKEVLRTDDDTLAWQAWNVAHDLIWQSCRPGPPLVFPGEKELIRAMYDQIGKEEQVISPPYTRTPLDASMRGQKKKKQGENNVLVGRLCSMAPCCALWCMTIYGWPDDTHDTSGSCFQPVVPPSLVTSSGGLLYLKRVAMRCQTLILSWKLECLDSSCSSTSAFAG